MGLTRPRAAQIYDIDYKQSVRVLTTSNITLSGSAPLVVDGVTLSLDDRILVTGQSTASQNGVYRVSVTGTGSNGTWVRTSDTNESGELLSGTVIMVTEGTSYADTSWKLTTNNPITIGSTSLTFEINTGNAFGTITANSTSIVANSATGTVTFVAGDNITITGNNSSKTVTFAAGSSTTAIANGTSNVTVVSSGGNVTVGTNGSERIRITSDGNVGIGTTSPAVKLDVVGAASVTGNVTGGNLITAGLGSIGTTLAVTGNANVGNLGTAGLIVATGNITGGNLITAGLGSIGTTLGVTGNITGGNLITAGLATVTGNITGGNLITGGLGSIGTTLAVTGNANVGNLGTAGLVVATGNITGGNLVTGGLATVTGNANVGNLGTAGLVVATGNVTGGNLITAALASVGIIATPKTLNANVTISANVNGVAFINIIIGNTYTVTIPDTSTLMIIP